MSRMRRPSHTTIVAYLALFVALGGSSYAAINLPRNSVGPKQIKKNAVRSPEIRNNAVTSRDIRNRTIRGRDVRPTSLSGRHIREQTLATVPQAANADTLAGLTASQLKVRCPAGTLLSSGTCIELTPRAPQSWNFANGTCAVTGRRLPTYGELVAFYNSQRPLASGGELTANLSESPTTPGQLNAVVILTATGSSVEFIDATAAQQRAFRCAAAPTN
ncbi:MAG: hypothetical protein WD993_06405 [Thermoleophilaceae bacterium]